MRFSDIAHLYPRRLRARVVQELLALVGIVVGVALMFAALVANSSLTGSVQQLTSGVVGESRYQLAARSPDGFSGRLLDAVRELPGVRDAAPILETRAVVRGPRGERSVMLVGGDPKFARLGGPLLQLFTSEQLARERAIALPTPIAEGIGTGFGEPVDVVTGGGSGRPPLGAQLHESEIGNLIFSPVALAPLAYAQQLSGLPGRVTRIFVQPAPGDDALVRAGLERLSAGRLNVLDAHADVDVFEQAATQTSQSTALFSAFAAVIGFLFALSAVLLTVPLRRDEIAVLRMSGHSARTIAKVLTFDAVVLGAVGAALGLLAGDLLSRQLFASTPGYLGFAFPVGSQRVVGSSSIAISIGAGLLASVTAVLAPVADAFFELPRRRGWRRRARLDVDLAILGGVLASAAAFVLLLAPAAAIGGLILLTGAMLLVLPIVLRLAVTLIVALGQRGHSAIPFIAASELRATRHRSRILALAATAAIAVFASVTVGGSHADLQRGLDASASAIDANADIWATFPGEPNAFATTTFVVEPSTIERLRGLPGVRSVSVYRGAFLDVGTRRIWVLAPPRDAPAPVPARQVDDGSLQRATERLRAGGWVVMSNALANEEGVGVGDTVRLPTPHPIRLRVAAVSTNLGWPPGALVMSSSDFATAWGSNHPSALQIRTQVDADPHAVEAAVKEALGTTPVQTETSSEREERHFTAAREGLSRLTHIAYLVLGAAIVALATAMGGMIWQRRSALANLKVHGRSSNELWRALLLESAVLLGSGCALGAIFGLGGQIMLSRAMKAVTGFPIFYTPGVVLAVAVVLLVLVSALVVLAVPGRLAAGVRPSPRPT